MIKNRYRIPLLCCLILAVTMLSGCTPSSAETNPTGNEPQPLETTIREPTVTETIPATPEETAVIETVPPTPEETDAAVETTAVAEASCTVLSDLNLRSGPGTPYRPPIRALPAGTKLVPLGFNPVGIIGGSWVHVRNESQNETGWVSAEARFISCDLDLTQLPQVNVPPPPPPPAPVVTDTGPDGGEQPESWKWELDFNPTYFLRMIVSDTESGTSNDGDGTKSVTFTVFDADGTEVYKRTENTAAYCAFGGGEPYCNPWIIENYAYRWTSGGEAAKSGLYTIIIEVEGSIQDEFGNPKTGLWNLRDVSIEFP